VATAIASTTATTTTADEETIELPPPGDERRQFPLEANIQFGCTWTKIEGETPTEAPISLLGGVKKTASSCLID
jgi:hypothetical protein